MLLVDFKLITMIFFLSFYQYFVLFMVSYTFYIYYSAFEIKAYDKIFNFFFIKKNNTFLCSGLYIY
jgi:hypothetical protein